MLNPELFISFLTVSLLLAVTPGPSNAFLMAQTFAKGKSAGIQSALGFAIAGVLHTLLMVLGLSALLKTNPTAYNLVLWLGAIYLVYLGFVSIKDSFQPAPLDSSEKPHVSTKKQKNVTVQAMMTELLNPKVAMFFIAFIPQFTDVSLSLSVTYQLLIFGLLYPVFAFPIDFAYVQFGDKIAGYFRANPRVQIWIDRITGVIFILLAVNLLLG
ncbi:MAG: LysE family translocator [Gammaproteobacteria bacterium]|nr:LysE family translocator [Gammaproteobacteria bacterium]